VPYSAEEMFALVADVRSYPTFLPWCADTHVRPQSDGSVLATVDIRYRGARFSFTTCNLQRPPTAIGMELVDGPFRRLSGEWTFAKLRADACKVHLRLNFQFASGVVGRAIAPVFEAIAGSLVDAFFQHAQRVHGARWGDDRRAIG